MDIELIFRKLLFIYVPFLIALCFHELAHALVALARGDNTAKTMGRLSLNPIAHMDLIGTLVLPLTLLIYASPIYFGWAKPVPVNPTNLKNPRWDMVLIALAGPAANVFLAVFCMVLIGALYPYLYETKFLSDAIFFSHFFIRLNLFLAAFNLIPVHPLDGGKVLAGFLPRNWSEWLEANQSTASIALFLIIIGGGLGFISAPITELSNAMMAFAVGEK